MLKSIKGLKTSLIILAASSTLALFGCGQNSGNAPSPSVPSANLPSNPPPSSTPTPPALAAISAQSTSEDTSKAVSFNITDVDSTLNCSSSMSASSSNTSIVAVSGIIFSGTAPNCTATITPVADANGSVNLTFRVSDTSLYMDRTFTLTVNPVNDAPTIGSISSQSVKSDASAVVNYSANDIDSTLDCSSSISLSSDNTSVIKTSDIVKSGTAPNCVLTISPSLNAAGTANISVTVSDGSLNATRSFAVTVVNVTGVAITPSSLSLAVAGSSQLTATVQYSDSSSANKTTSSSMVWSSANSSIASVDNTSAKGLATGAGAGNTTISASYFGVNSNAVAVSVLAATSLSVSSGAVSGGIGSQAVVTATAQNSSTTFDVTNSATWSSSNTSVATVSNGVISFVGAGSAVVTASYAGLTANVNVTVASKTLVSLTVSASDGSATVATNGTKNLIATATYSDSSTDIVTNSVTWSSANNSVLTVSNTAPKIGQVTGVAGGTSTVTAVLGSTSGNLLVSVNSVTISSIAVTPYDALVASGASYNLRAIATYSDASSSDVTDLVTWSSSNTSAATISNTSGSKGLATTPTFSGYLSTTITATLNSVSGTTPLGVNGATITSIIVTPTVTVTANQTYQLKAYGNMSDGGVIDLTDFAVWSSSTPAKVTVSNSVGSKGVITGIATGSSNLTAQFGSVSGSRTVTVGASSSLTEIGVGLSGIYYTWTGSPPPSAPFQAANEKGRRIDAQVNYAWGSGNAPMGVGDQFAVRWTGYYKATSSTNYFCAYSDDGIRIWVNGTQIINNWTDHGPTWNCTSNIALTVGTKYSVVIEYYENGGGSEAHFTRSSTSAADAQNTSTRAIPQSDLYPY